jgi:hypothetical protein
MDYRYFGVILANNAAFCSWVADNFPANSAAYSRASAAA